ncbi:MAG: hypothetical protein V1647_06695 [Pseudomonadota bacterium]
MCPLPQEKQISRIDHVDYAYDGKTKVDIVVSYYILSTVKYECSERPGGTCKDYKLSEVPKCPFELKYSVQGEEIIDVEIWVLDKTKCTQFVSSGYTVGENPFTGSKKVTIKWKDKSNIQDEITSELWIMTNMKGDVLEATSEVSEKGYASAVIGVSSIETGGLFKESDYFSTMASVKKCTK